MRADRIVPALATAGVVGLGTAMSAATGPAVDVGAPAGVGTLLVAGAVAALTAANARDEACDDAYRAGAREAMDMVQERILASLGDGEG